MQLGAWTCDDRLVHAPRRLMVWLALLAAIALGRSARADGTGSSTPLGGRSALMGQTGVALGRDGASPFLNPATIVRIGDERLAFSVNFYRYAVTHISDWYQPGPVDAARFGALNLGDARISSQEFDILPSTLCFFATIEGPSGKEKPDLHHGVEAAQKGRQKLALCLATTQRQSFDLTAETFTGGGAVQSTQTQSMFRRWTRFQVGPTYAIHATDELAFGATLHGGLSTFRNVFSVHSLTTGGPQPIASTFYKGAASDSLDLGGTLGATLHLSPHTFGVSVTTPTLHVFGISDENYFTQYSGANNESTWGRADGEFIARAPVEVRIGHGIEWKDTTLETNVGYRFAQPDAAISKLKWASAAQSAGAVTPSNGDDRYADSTQGALTVAMGLEHYVLSTFSLLGGVNVSTTDVPALSSGRLFANHYQARATRVALSAGVGSHAASGEFLFGVEVGHSIGTMLAANPYQVPATLDTVDYTTTSALLVLAGSTSLGAIKQAVEDAGGLIAPKKKKQKKNQNKGSSRSDGRARRAPRATKPDANKPVRKIPGDADFQP